MLFGSSPALPAPIVPSNSRATARTKRARPPPRRISPLRPGSELRGLDARVTQCGSLDTAAATSGRSWHASAPRLCEPPARRGPTGSGIGASAQPHWPDHSRHTTTVLSTSTCSLYYRYETSNNYRPLSKTYHGTFTRTITVWLYEYSLRLSSSVKDSVPSTLLRHLILGTSRLVHVKLYGIKLTSSSMMSSGIGPEGQRHQRTVPVPARRFSRECPPSHVQPCLLLHLFFFMKGLVASRD